MPVDPAGRLARLAPRQPAGETALSNAAVKIAIAGALGRMGQALATAVEADARLAIAARFERPGVEGEGLVSAEAARSMADVILDFTTPEASVALAQACAAAGGPRLVIGTTGLDEAQKAAIAEAASRVAIVYTTNYSLGVAMLVGLVEQAARQLGPEAYDIEIFEAHHHRKVDAPSGTALTLGEAAARGRGVRLGEVSERARDGITGARKTGDIGFAVMRGGGIIGEHSVTFAAEDEIITLSHSARARSLFARGAAAAAAWVAGRPPGLYDLQDVLGFTGRR